LRSELFILACSDKVTLHDRLNKMAHFLQRVQGRDLHTVIRNTAHAIKQDSFKFAAVARDIEHLSSQLVGFGLGKKRPDIFVTDPTKIAGKLLWAFPGFGMVSMHSGHQLLHSEPVFADIFNECAAHIEHYFGQDNTQAFWDLNENNATAMLVQLRLFALQAALSALWKHWGVEPDGVIGHSFGEIAAAYTAGAINLKTAIYIVGTRSQLLDSIRSQGGMVSIDCSQKELNLTIPELPSNVCIAAENSQKNFILSGDTKPLRDLEELLADAGIRSQWLVDTAGHSHQVAPLRNKLEAALHNLVPQAPQVPFYSTVTGGLMDEELTDAKYWGKNMCQPVLFSNAMSKAITDGFTQVLELSAQPILLPAVVQISRHTGAKGVTAIPSLRRGKPERDTMLRAAAQLYVTDTNLHWNIISDPHIRNHIS